MKLIAAVALLGCLALAAADGPRCTPAIANCKEHNRGCLTCKECREGFGLQAGACVACADLGFADCRKCGTPRYSTTLQCFECSTGFGRDSATGACVACPAGCKKCTAASGVATCRECFEGLSPIDGVCTACADVGVANCRRCAKSPIDASLSCVECARGYGVDIATGQCAACSAACKKCSWNGATETCQECADGYGRASLAGACTECTTLAGVQNCGKCGIPRGTTGTTPKCFECLDGFRLQTTSTVQTCVACTVANCAECKISRGVEVCDECASGWLKNPVTRVCDTPCADPNCDECEIKYGVQVCDDCKRGWAKDATGACTVAI